MTKADDFCCDWRFKVLNFSANAIFMFTTFTNDLLNPKCFLWKTGEQNVILEAYGTETCFHGQALLKNTNFYYTSFYQILFIFS